MAWPVKVVGGENDGKLRSGELPSLVNLWWFNGILLDFMVV